MPRILLLALVAVFCMSNCVETSQRVAATDKELAGSDTVPVASKADTKLPEDITRIARGDMTDLKPRATVVVDGGLSMLCRLPQPNDYERVKEAYGPHAMKWVTYFANDAAATASKEKKAYPPGATIVKYKLHDDEKDKKTTGVGGMIKREAGFDLEHGDWEYFYFEDPKQVAFGKLETCVNCHRLAAKTDYVFGRWATAAKE